MDQQSKNSPKQIDELHQLRQRIAQLEAVVAETRAQQYLGTQLAVTRILAECSTTSAAIPAILQVICEELGWVLGAFWRLDRPANLLRCEWLWRGVSIDLEPFIRTTRQSSLAPGSGLPGRVWAAGEPIWVPDVLDDPDFMRAASAGEAGLHAAFAVPIRLGQQVLGVMEFFYQHVEASNDSLLTTMAVIGGQIGQFMERIAAEEARHEIDERFQLFMRNLPGLAFIKDHQGRFVYINEAYEQLFGWQRDDWHGKMPRELFDPEIAERFLASDRQVFQSKAVVQSVEVIPQADGPRFYLVSKFPILDRHGLPMMVGGIGIDITERRQAEEDLQDSEGRFRQLAEHINGVFWMSDPHTPAIIYISPAYAQIWGRSCESLYAAPQSYLQAVHPDDRERVLAALERQLRGENTDEEYRIVRPDGAIRWIWDRGFPIKDRTGQVSRIAGIAEDVTARRLSEDARHFLAEASSTLAASLDFEVTLQRLAQLAVPALADWCVIDMLEEDGTVNRLEVTHVDPAKTPLARELHKHYLPRPDAPYGLPYVLRTGQSELLPEIADSVLEATASTPEHLAILRAVGLRSAMIVPLIARGRTLGALTFVAAESGRRYTRDDLILAEDLARRAALAIDNARLYQQAHQALQARDQFLSIAAHELKTPITALLSYTQLLQRRGEREGVLNVRDQRALQALTEQARRLHRLSVSLLDLSRIQTNRLTIDRGPVDLRALAQRVIEELQPTLERHFVELDGPEIPLVIEGDELRLEQVLQNLLQNAVKYSPHGGTIRVELGQRQRQVYAAVSDQGIGIPAEALPRLFSSYYRASNVDSQQIGGMGLGLYVVKEIVSLHGGNVEVASSEGQGSTFTILLPLIEDRAP